MTESRIPFCDLGPTFVHPHQYHLIFFPTLQSQVAISRLYGVALPPFNGAVLSSTGLCGAGDRLSNKAKLDLTLMFWKQNNISLDDFLGSWVLDREAGGSYSLNRRVASVKKEDSAEARHRRCYRVPTGYICI